MNPDQELADAVKSSNEALNAGIAKSRRDLEALWLARQQAVERASAAGLRVKGNDFFATGPHAALAEAEEIISVIREVSL